MNNKKLLISLCAGRGSRLTPLTDSTHKSMITLSGIPILQNQIDIFSAYVSDNIVVGGHLSDTLYLGQGSLTVNADYMSTNMVYSLMCARERFSDYDEIYISYGDIIYNENVIQSLESSDKDFSIVVDEGWLDYWRKRFSDPLSDAESLKLDNNNLIVDIGNKVASVDDIQAQYIGLMKFSRYAMSIISDIYDAMAVVSDEGSSVRSRTNMYMTDLIQRVIARGHDVHPIFIRGGGLR